MLASSTATELTQFFEGKDDTQKEQFGADLNGEVQDDKPFWRSSTRYCLLCCIISICQFYGSYYQTFLNPQDVDMEDAAEAVVSDVVRPLVEANNLAKVVADPTTVPSVVKHIP